MGDRYSTRSPGRRGPPRDRGPPPRDRDDHPNVEYFGAGESYRPGGQTGDGPYRPMRDRENDRWNPPDRRDRDDRRRDEIDSYIPPTSSRAPRNRSRSPPPYRRRSRSPPPPARNRTELFPDRGNRSPPSRRYSPQRSDRARSPPRRRSRSPYGARGRSPDNKRPRDFTPDGRASPKRDRYDSPPRARYNDRARSPPRRGASPMHDTYRPRSRTPPRPNYAEDRRRRRSPSPRDSGATSRRSSPPVHADRTSVAGSRPHSPPRRYDDREPYTSRPRSPPRRDRDRSRDKSRDRDDAPTAPLGPRGSSYDRPPPSGPSKSYTSTTSPPPGPSASVSAHNRSGTFAPPSGPRGSGPPRDFVSPPGAVRGRTSLTYRAPGYRPPLPNQSGFEASTSPVNAPPSGPRASSFSRGDYGGGSRGGYPSAPSRSSSSSYHASNDFPFRPNMNNSTSTTYPRSQRFNTGSATSVPVGPSSVSTSFNIGPATATTVSPTTSATPANFVKSQLSTLERIVPGGKHVPGSAQSTTGLSADQEKRLKSLDDEADRMRSDIVEKQRAKRESLSDWEARDRESTIAALRSDLAESHLRALGEDDTAMTGTAF